MIADRKIAKGMLPPGTTVQYIDTLFFVQMLAAYFHLSQNEVVYSVLFLSLFYAFCDVSLFNTSIFFLDK